MIKSLSVMNPHVRNVVSICEQNTNVCTCKNVTPVHILQLGTCTCTRDMLSKD